MLRMSCVNANNLCKLVIKVKSNSNTILTSFKFKLLLHCAVFVMLRWLDNTLFTCSLSCSVTNIVSQSEHSNFSSYPTTASAKTDGCMHMLRVVRWRNYIAMVTLNLKKWLQHNKLSSLQVTWLRCWDAVTPRGSCSIRLIVANMWNY